MGTVTVYWEVSEDGRADLEPGSGNVTFAEVRMRFVSLCKCNLMWASGLQLLIARGTLQAHVLGPQPKDGTLLAPYPGFR